MERAENPMHEPLSELEQQLYDQLLRSAGYDPAEMRTRTDEVARNIKKSVSVAVSGELANIQCRSQLTRHLHGQA
jgi:hypothetical protein